MTGPAAEIEVRADRRLCTAKTVVPLLILALWVQGLVDLVSGHPFLTSWVASVVLALLWGTIAMLCGRPLAPLRSAGAIAIVGWSGMTFFTALSALVGGANSYAVAVVCAQTGNLLLLALIGSSRFTRKDLLTLNRRILRIGAASCLLALVAFIPQLLDVKQIVADPQNWNPGLWYVLDRGVALRLTGLVGDPNFFALYATLPLALAIFELRSRWRILIGGLVLLVCLLTLSRSFAAAGAVTGLLWLARHAWMRRFPIKLAIGIMALVVGSVGLLAVFQSWRSFALERWQLASDESRFNVWSRLRWTDDGWIFGRGVGASREQLGRYAHNTFIDMSYDVGFAGLSCWLLFLLAVSVVAWIHLRSDDGLGPWAIAWFVGMVMLTTFSLGFNPYLVVVGGVLVAAHARLSSRSRRADILALQPPVD